MAELKTKQTDLSVDSYIEAIADEGRRSDCRSLIDLMAKATKEPPKMWGPGIVGFGTYHYKYASGHEGDMCLTGFASRKQDLTLYVMSGLADREALLAKLGKHRTGKACLYVKQLSDIDLEVLERVVELSIEDMKRRYP